VYAASLLVDDRAHHFTISSVLALVGLVVTALVAVPYLQLLGIAIARGVMLFVMLASVSYFVWKGGRLVLDKGAFVKSLGAAGVAGSFITLTLAALQPYVLAGRAASVVASIVMLFLGLVVYLLVMKSLKGFTEADIDFISTLLPPRLRGLLRVARWLL